MWALPIVVILIVIALIYILKSIKIVPESRVLIVEKLGKYDRSLSSGLSFLNPFFDRVARSVSLKEQVVDFPPQPVITKDNATMQIDTVVYFQITDPKLYTYGVERPLSAIENLTATTLRNIIGDMTVDQTLTSRDVINTKMRKELDDATDPWGIKVENVELKDIALPEELKRVISRVAEAEREKQAVITKSQGEVEASENLARAAEVMGNTPGALHLRTLATLNDLSSDQSNTVIFALPVEALEAMKGLSNIGKK